MKIELKNDISGVCEVKGYRMTIETVDTYLMENFESLTEALNLFNAIPEGVEIEAMYLTTSGSPCYKVIFKK